MPTFLVRYGETGLKGPAIRRRFEQILLENIVRAHTHAGASCLVDRKRGRLFVTSDSTETTMKILRRSFGVVSFSQVIECSSDPREICKCAIEIGKELLSPGKSFAVRARRTGSHGYTSMELAAEVGRGIIEAFGKDNIQVSLSDPDVEIFVEVREKKAFLFSEVIEGPGGFPLRTQGRVLSLIEDKRSLLASWLIMRRGGLCFTMNMSELDEREIELLKPWNPWWAGVAEASDLSSFINLKRCSGIVVGWTLDEFMSKSKPNVGVPLFYPLIGMTSDEIEAWIAKLDL